MLSPATRTPPLRIDGLRRVLVVRPDNIGDVVMLGPALRALRAAAPAAEIVLLASPAGAQAASLLPWLDRVMAERVSWQQLPGDATTWEPRHDRDLIARLRRGRFDAAFVFTSFSQSPWPAAYACLLAGIPVRVGRPLGFGGVLLTHEARPLPDGTHQVERSLELLEAVGIPVADRGLEIAIPRHVTRAAERALASLGIDCSRPYLVFAPGASCDARRIPDALAEAVAGRLAAPVSGPGWPVVLVGGAGDADRLEPIARLDGVRSLVGSTTIPELAAVIAGARLLVTAHSAPMHLADATGTPIVVAFSGTDRESEWGPRSSQAALLRRETGCAPCRAFTCPIGMTCLDLDPGAVVAAAMDLLGHASANGSAAA